MTLNRDNLALELARYVDLRQLADHVLTLIGQIRECEWCGEDTSTAAPSALLHRECYEKLQRRAVDGAKPAAASPAREALVDILSWYSALAIGHELRPEACEDLADAILAKFPGKLQLRRMPTRDEWLALLRSSWLANDGTVAEGFVQQTDAVLAKLAELATPVVIDEEKLAELMMKAVYPNHPWFPLYPDDDPDDAGKSWRLAARAAIAYMREWEPAWG